jgi:hypothetical protein
MNAYSAIWAWICTAALIVYRIRATKLCSLRRPGSYRLGQIADYLRS